MKQDSTVVFVCEHGAAKSILAAAYFNRLAAEHGLDIRAIARGTHPDPELSPQTVQGLSEDGLAPTESSPQQLSLADVRPARRIISFCDLPEEFQNQTQTDRWEEVPPVSEDYEKARDAILEHLNRLIEDIRGAG